MLQVRSPKDRNVSSRRFCAELLAGNTDHVTPKANLQHLYSLVAERWEVLLIHVMVAVRRDLVGSLFCRDLVEGLFGFQRPHLAGGR